MRTSSAASELNESLLAQFDDPLPLAFSSLRAGPSSSGSRISQGRWVFSNSMFQNRCDPPLLSVVFRGIQLKLRSLSKALPFGKASCLWPTCQLVSTSLRSSRHQLESLVGFLFGSFSPFRKAGSWLLLSSYLTFVLDNYLSHFVLEYFCVVSYCCVVHSNNFLCKIQLKVEYVWYIQQPFLGMESVPLKKFAFPPPGLLPFLIQRISQVQKSDGPFCSLVPTLFLVVPAPGQSDQALCDPGGFPYFFSLSFQRVVKQKGVFTFPCMCSSLGLVRLGS